VHQSTIKRSLFLLAGLAALTACGGKRKVHKAADDAPIAPTVTEAPDTTTTRPPASVDTPTTTQPDTPPPSGVTPDDLAGKWRGACTPTAPDDKTSTRRDYTFAGTALTIAQMSFSDAGCTAPVSITALHMHYDLGTTKDGLTPVDLTLGQATYTPLSTQDANDMADAAACGYADWQRNATKDVTGRKCYDDKDPVQAGQKAYDILALAQDELRFGLAGDAFAGGAGSTPEKRPTAVRADTPLKRAP
jgi:hypothetical protein